MNVDILWSNLLSQIKDELTSLSYSTWFSETKLYKLDNEIAYIIVPMPIHKKHLIDNYSSLITTKLADLTGANFEWRNRKWNKRKENIARKINY